MGIGLVVEGADFAISTALVEGLGLGKRLVRFETEKWKALFPRELLETMQDALPNAEAARRRPDPHALDLAIGRMALQGPAPNRLAVQRGQDEEAVRRRELLGGGRYAHGGIVACLEARVEFFVVAGQAILSGGARGILHVQADRAREEQ